jgi:PTS system mannose-specific IIA component
MIVKLLVSHGHLAEELLGAARAIVGEVEGFSALSLPWDEDCDTVERRLRDRIAEIDQGKGVLVLTELYGNTPCNAARRVLSSGRVEMVTGMNLAMVVRLACPPPAEVETLAELAEWIEGKGRAAIRTLHGTAPEEAVSP